MSIHYSGENGRIQVRSEKPSEPTGPHKRVFRAKISERGELNELRRSLRKLRSRRNSPSFAPRRETSVTPAPQPASQLPRLTRLDAERHVPFDEAIEGEEVTTRGGHRAYLISTTPQQVDSSYSSLADQLRSTLTLSQSGLCRALERAGLTALEPGQKMLFMDLETTGLGSSPLFLVGTMTWDGQSLLVRQYLARDYTEEAAAIGLFADRAADCDLLVSFNGKAFDLPYLRMRAAATRVPMPAELPHLDLLYESRRAWRAVLPNCRLETLEQRLLGRTRDGDIPGRLIPEAYHEFVRTGNAARLAAIVRHNLLDLLTMAELMVRLP